jgi:FixJ family two-component response regulator
MDMNTAAPPVLDAAGAASRCLLLVDDETHILSALKRLLRRDGYTIHTATGGQEALHLLAREPVGVVLTDQRMPGMTGVELLRHVKQLYPDTVRITLSGYTELQSIIDAVNDGAVYKFLTKPWDDERLRGHVAEAFAQKALADDNRRLQAQVHSGHAELARLNQRLSELLLQAERQARLAQAGALSLRDLVDAMPLAVLALDAQGLVVQANATALDWLPWLASAVGQPAGEPLRLLMQPPPGPATTAPAGCTKPRQMAGEDCLTWQADIGDATLTRGRLLMIAPWGRSC